jgi:hypothetical protein
LGHGTYKFFVSDVQAESQYLSEPLKYSVDPSTVESCGLPVNNTACEPLEIIVHPPVEDTNALQLVAAGFVGVILVGGLMFLGKYAYHNPNKFKSLIVSILLNEVAVIVGLALEIWDFSGDTILFYTVMTETPEAKEQIGGGVLVLWVIFYALASLVSFTGMALKVKVFLELRKRRSSEFVMDGVDLLDPYSDKERSGHTSRWPCPHSSISTSARHVGLHSGASEASDRCYKDRAPILC